jgi:hypothetical protein
MFHCNCFAKQMDLYSLWLSQHINDMFAFCFYYIRTLHLRTVENIRTQTFADIENVTSVRNVLRLCGFYESVLANQHSRNLSVSENDDNSLYHCHTNIFLQSFVFSRN